MRREIMSIDIYTKIQDPVAAIDRMGEWFASSGMFGCTRPEQGKILAMTCLAEKKSPFVINRTYHIIDGKLSKKSMAALAQFRGRGGRYKWIKTGEEPVSNEDDREAVGEFTYDGQTVTARFSIRDAKRAEYIRRGSAWEKTPAKMLRARVSSNAIGMIAPEVYAGDEDESEIEVTHDKLDLATTTTVAEAPVKMVTQENATTPLIEEPKQEVVAAPPATVQPEALTDDVVEQLEQSIGEHAVAAVNWMLKEKWIQPGQGLQHLKPTQATRIMKQRDSFIRAITT